MKYQYEFISLGFSLLKRIRLSRFLFPARSPGCEKRSPSDDCAKGELIAESPLF
jgi:hypothetical protein